jgi:hypothetical protein
MRIYDLCPRCGHVIVRVGLNEPKSRLGHMSKALDRSGRATCAFDTCGYGENGRETDGKFENGEKSGGNTE